MTVVVLLVVQCVYLQLYEKQYSCKSQSSLVTVVENVRLNLDMSERIICDWKIRQVPRKMPCRACLRVWRMGKIKFLCMGIGPLVGLLGHRWWKRKWIYVHCNGVVWWAKWNETVSTKKYTHNYIVMRCWGGRGGLYAFHKFTWSIVQCSLGEGEWSCTYKSNY